MDGRAGDSPVEPANDDKEASEQTEEAEPESEEEEPKSRPATYPAAWIHDDWKEPERKGLPVWIILLIILISVAIVALVAFMVLARVAPDFIDTLLYTPDELRIINY